MSPFDNRIIQEDVKEIAQRNIEWENLMHTSILITGAYGMIASYCAFMIFYLNETCQNAGIELYLLGRSEYKMKKRFGELLDRPYCHMIISELKDEENVLPAGMDYVIHAASPASSQFFASAPLSVIEPNVFGTYALLRAVKACKSFLFVSSGEVYGNTNIETVSEMQYGISDPLDIRYSYGESKRMGECICNAFFYQYHIPVKIVRLGHTYGPTMDISSDKRVFSEFVANVVKKEDILIKSDGKGMRAFCYTADAAAAFYTVLLQGENGNAYNVANRKGLLSIRELAECLKGLFPERNLQIRYGFRDLREDYVESRQKKHSIPCTEKIEALGWECKYDVQTGFYRTVTGIEEFGVR